MLSDVTTLASLVQQAPALAVGLLGLLFGLWSYRQSRKALADAENRQLVSNVSQGRRLGRLSKAVMLLDMRRRIVETELAQRGLRLSPWPSDGPLPFYDDDPDDEDDDEDQADDEAADLDTAHLETQYFVPPRPTPSRRTS